MYGPILTGLCEVSQIHQVDYKYCSVTGASVMEWPLITYVFDIVVQCC